MRLPRLTLFTGGPACTLCTVAKADLALVQARAPFHLALYDIRRPFPPGPDDYERTVWRRMYQYEIPVLRWSEDDSFEALSGRTGKGGQVMRHRIDKDKLVGLIQKWTAEMNPSSTSENTT